MTGPERPYAPTAVQEADLPADDFDVGRGLYRQEGRPSEDPTEVFVELDVFTGSLSDLLTATRRKAVDARLVETRRVVDQVLNRDRSLPPNRIEDRLAPIGSAAELVGLKATALGAERRPVKADPAGERDREWYARRAGLRRAVRRLDERDVKGRDVFGPRRKGKIGGAKVLPEQSPDSLRETWDVLVKAAREREAMRRVPHAAATIPFTEAEARSALTAALFEQGKPGAIVGLRELAQRLGGELDLPSSRVEGVLTLAAVYAAASGDFVLVQDRPDGPLGAARP